VKRCVSHHFACDCREAEFAALKADVRPLVEAVNQLQATKGRFNTQLAYDWLKTMQESFLNAHPEFKS